MLLQTEAVAPGEIFQEAVDLVVEVAAVLVVLAEEVPVAVAPEEAGNNNLKKYLPIMIIDT